MKDLDWELFDRYLANAATPAERSEFERWLAERPERAEFLRAWNHALEKLESDVAAADRNAVWAGSLEQIGGRPDAGARMPRHKTWRMGAGIAAAAAVITAAVLGGKALLRDGSGGTQAAERVVTVPRGERARLRLPDGSEVTLAAGSTLRYPAEFPGTSREVILEGEGFFTVEHEARRPFRVEAGDLIATDLGTEFLVRAYPEDAGARVVVRSGEVSVRAKRSPGMSHGSKAIGPGQLGRLEAGGMPRVDRADTAAYFAWTRGTLVLDGTPLRDALPQLSRWYNLEFQLADSSLGSIPLSGRLDQTLTDARLDLLAGSLGLRSTKRGSTVIFSRP